MPRRERTVIPFLPHHVTQRGTRKQDVFFTPDDRRIYLELLAKYAERHGAELLAYTLMTNHVHHLVVPHTSESLRWTFQMTHKRYAEYLNAKNGWTGHVWQAKFYSSPVDEEYFWVALRYIYQNPVAAGLSLHPAQYPWSSANAHCSDDQNPYIAKDSPLAQRIFRKSGIRTWLGKMPDTEQVMQLRQRTLRDLPTGSSDFLDLLEQSHGARVQIAKMGRPKKVGKS